MPRTIHVKRYWPGKVPEYADNYEEAAAVEPIVPNYDDGRLRHWINNRNQVRAADHGRFRKAEIEEDSRMLEFEDVDDDDAIAERRIRLKEEWLRREQEQSPAAEEEEEEEEEEEFEYETDSDDTDKVGQAPAVKSVFVPKSERHTIAERERLEAEQRALEKVRIRRLEERRLETKQILVQEVWKDQEIHKANIITDEEEEDDVNEAEEYEAWKVREIGRIKRVREDREAILKEKQETQRLRNMSEEERIREWEIRNKNPNPPGQSKHKKNKWRFMQRYYHCGAFFQDQLDTIMLRDFSAPTGEDKMDKTILPSVMQVKRWTDLINEDTTHHRTNPSWTCNDLHPCKV